MVTVPGAEPPDCAVTIVAALTTEVAAAGAAALVVCTGSAVPATLTAVPDAATLATAATATLDATELEDPDRWWRRSPPVVNNTSRAPVVPVATITPSQAAFVPALARPAILSAFSQ